MRTNRLISLLLALVMVLSMLPAQAFAATISYQPNSQRNCTVTVTDEDGNRVTGATLTVTYGNNTYTVYESGNGQYIFTRNTTYRYAIFSITVEKDGYETKTVTMTGNTSNLAVTVAASTPVIPEDEYADMNLFYIANGIIPDSYQGAGEAVNYGPSANNTPLCVLRVNLTQLRTYTDAVDYTEGQSGNQWAFTPKGESTGAVNAQVVAFWEAVLECCTAESLESLDETGLGDAFYAYCLKKQGDSSQHMDGVLNVTPPVYVVELYQNEVFFGGGITDSAENSKFLTAYDILDQYEAHLKQTITWVEDGNGRPALVDGSYWGTYVDPATNKIHNIQVFQTNTEGTEFVEGSEIPYTKQSDTYYLAQYNMSVDAGTDIEYLITYTDGVDGEVVFTNHEYAAKRGDVVPAYTGITVREGYAFLGWFLEGSADQTKLYSDAEIAQMTVSGNMTFHAVWQALPRYTGKIILILDGTYDAATDTLLSGTPVDTTDLGYPENQTLFLSADGVTFIPLVHEATGTYSASLYAGTYQIYYSPDDGENYYIASDRVLVIENVDRTRYLFYNTLTHDPNGGAFADSAEKHIVYYASGTAAYVLEEAPTREGYIFLGWEEQNDPGSLYQPEALIHSGIDHPCTLVAQWKKDLRATVNLTVQVDHAHAAGIDPNPSIGSMTVELVYRANENDPYVEMVGDAYTHTYADWYEAAEQIDTSSYVTYAPFHTDLAIEYQYSVNAIVPDYILYDRQVTATEDAEGNITYDVVLKLRYDPDLFQVTYHIVADESISDPLIPKAVDIKLYSWDARIADAWAPISRHVDYAVDVLFEGRNGQGSYPVPVYKDTHELYYYIAMPVGFTLADGTELTASPSSDGLIWYSNAAPGYPEGAFWATVEIDGDAIEGTSIPGVHGIESADGYIQHGSITITVYTKNYNVTFDPNGGQLNGTSDATVLTEQYVAPNPGAYIPTREGGYVFEGWYLADENGNMTDATVTAGETLTQDITLIAKWKEPIRVEGIITAAGAYEHVDEDGVVTVIHIDEGDRVGYVTVVLQRMNPSGYYETVAQQHVNLDYSLTDYYFPKDENTLLPVGMGTYAFTGLADDGSSYRIQILSANYHSTYQHEPAAADSVQKLKYDTYTAGEYTALLGEVDPKVATVNAHLHFEPPVFQLQYQVDASAIGTGYRPTGAELLITNNDNYAITTPHLWSVINEMKDGSGFRGDMVEMGAEGHGSSGYPVWICWPDGTTLYDYALRLHSTVTDGEQTLFTEDDPRFTVAYQAPAHYTADGQSQMLIAYLLPKTYTVTFEANGGVLSDSSTYSHTWSYTTNLPQLTPTRTGYRFLGWFADEALTQPVTPGVVEAAVAEDITYYAGWEQVMDTVHLEVVIDHTTLNEGLASNYEKYLSVTLTRREEDTEQDFLPVDGCTRVYDHSYWHTRGDGVTEDVLEVPELFTGLSSSYDYNVIATLDGYYREAQLEAEYTAKEVHADGSATHYVYVYLKFEPDLLELSFSVEMAEGVDENLYPTAADVKITSWYDLPSEEEEALGWHVISQHTHSVVQVQLDGEGKGSGTGSYPVWQWLNAEYAVPYHYRMEVVALQLSDGSTLRLEEQTPEILYAAGGYSATVYAENGCQIPQNVTDDGVITPADTQLVGAYGVSAQLQEADGSTVYIQQGTLKAVIDVGKLVFHSNNPDAEDTFRTYFPAVAPLPEGSYYPLNTDGTVDPFYAIPEFDYSTHNQYIFKGWYLDADSQERPMDWNTVWEGNAHVYAHWIEVGQMEQDEADPKRLPDGYQTYKEYDLVGVQIRQETRDDQEHYGSAASGLRFIASLSNRIWEELTALDADAQYGFLLANGDTARYFAEESGKEDYQILYKGANANGLDTRADFAFVQNVRCSGVVDHFGCDTYRLYTAVVTYNGLEGEALASAHATDLLARAYLRYTDANGLTRVHYHNYAGTNTFHGCAVSYDTVEGLLEGN